MTDDGWAALTPELVCTSVEASQSFYLAIGFSVKFARRDEGFAYLEMGAAQIMLEQVHEESWITGPLDRPFGRGLNFQIEVTSMDQLEERLRLAGIVPFRESREQWYRDGDIEHGQIEILVQDPDGYLLRLVEVLGSRPA